MSRRHATKLGLALIAVMAALVGCEAPDEEPLSTRSALDADREMRRSADELLRGARPNESGPQDALRGEP